MSRKRFRSARRHESAPVLNFNHKRAAIRSENHLASIVAVEEDDTDEHNNSAAPPGHENFQTNDTIQLVAGLEEDASPSPEAPSDILDKTALASSDVLDDAALLEEDLHSDAAQLEGDLLDELSEEDNSYTSAPVLSDSDNCPIPLCVQIGMKTWKSTSTLLGAFLTRGGDSLTRSKYEMFLRLMHPLFARMDRDQPPSYSTLLRSVYPFLKAHCLPKIQRLPHVENVQDSLEKTASVITPSSWALYDVQNYSFYRSVYDSERTADLLSFNNSPLVVSRNIVLDDRNQLVLPSGFSFIKLRRNDKMEIILTSIPKGNVPGVIKNGRKAVVRGVIMDFITGCPSELQGLGQFLRNGDLTARFALTNLNDNSNWYLTTRFWVTAENKQRIIMFRETKTHIQKFFVSRVNALTSSESLPPQQKSNAGVLPDGTPYVVYRFILFHDDFDVARTLLRKCSIGGVYLLPADLPSYQKTAPSSIRTISLTPPSMSSLDILELISDDIKVATTDGVLGRDPFGAPVRVYLDLCGVLADFHEASDGFQTLNHSGTAGCNLCNFRKNVSKFDKSSKNGHSTSSHSRNSAFMRTTWRHYDLHNSGMSEDEANFLGMKLSSDDSKSTPVFLELERALSAYTTGLQLDHIKWHYKAYPCSVVGPDHCIVGNIKNALRALFTVLESNSERAVLNSIFSKTLVRMELPRQKRVYNIKSENLNTTSFSNTYAIFSVTPAVLHLYSCKRSLPVNSEFQRMKRVFFILFRLVNLVMFFPHPESGEIQEIERIFGPGRESYFREVQKFASLYVSCVNVMVKNDSKAGPLLDKPNLHRLLELAMHTIPVYGHVHHISDLTYEHKHQSLKRAYHRANNHQKGNHHWAVRMEMYDQWKTRLTSAFSRMASPNSNSEHIQTSRIELYTLLFGRDATDLLSSEHIQYRSVLDRSIVQMFSESLRDELSFRSRQQCFSETLKTALRAKIISKFPNIPLPFLLFSSSAFRNSGKSDTVICGSIVQETITDNQGLARRNTLYVLGFMSDKSKNLFIFGYPLSELLMCPNVVDPPLPCFLYEPFRSTTVLQIFPLDSKVRRVAEYAVCTEGCIPSSSKQCHETPKGIPLFIQNRLTGYPPHSA